MESPTSLSIAFHAIIHAGEINYSNILADVGCITNTNNTLRSYSKNAENKIRYTNFDPEELARVACEAMGSYNKAFRLTLDDSSKVIARLPCPLAGPSYFVTASEVATLEFAREVLELLFPKVITWSGAKRGIGSASTTSLWKKFLDLYFKEDVSEDLQTLPLLSGNTDVTIQQLSEKYRVGPLIDHQWWRGERAQMALDRGPWTDATSFFIAAAENEQKFLDQCGSTSSLYRRKPTHDKAVHSKLLAMYKEAISLLMPPSDSEVCAPTLWHPDLSLGNLFVSESGPANLQGIIDWQHVAILPYFSYASIPPALVYRGNKIDMDGPLPGPLPSNIEELSVEEQKEYRLQLRMAHRHKLYQAKASSNPRRIAATNLSHIHELMMLPTYVTRAWADGVFDLREALMVLRKKWTTIAAPGTACPIIFSAEEIAQHEEQMESFRCYEAAVSSIYSVLHCEGDGWVAHEDYEVVRRLIDNLEETWDEKITGTPFPFKDGEYSYFLS
ncbi:hypothetical protein EW145_g1261 [Phellinidium pouzarii]|uniref:Altered inheritance of mitochondria protein 9, mitochondrial n=1 Tax=Phellinidium pouzarii TaxID=167371 RepID=A0A4S4LGY8_9AGAM|nr:hypothetical protein EW145_g1261 [Phellinidium pouzarii]